MPVRQQDHCVMIHGRFYLCESHIGYKNESSSGQHSATQFLTTFQLMSIQKVNTILPCIITLEPCRYIKPFFITVLLHSCTFRQYGQVQNLFCSNIQPVVGFVSRSIFSNTIPNSSHSLLLTLDIICSFFFNTYDIHHANADLSSMPTVWHVEPDSLDVHHTKR